MENCGLGRCFWIYTILHSNYGEGNGTLLRPVLLLGKSHGQRSLVGCSPRGCWELDTTERLHFHFSLSSIGEGNGNPLQCSCLENPRDRRAWWAAIYGVAQSRTQLKRLSSSSTLIKFVHDTQLLEFGINLHSDVWSSALAF